MFKNKILATYYPDKYLNVFSESHVDFFLYELGIKFQSNLNIEDKRRLLIEYKNNNSTLKTFSNYLFMVFLYYWNDPKINEIRLLPMSSKYEFPDMSYKEIQNNFFLNTLINERDGHYHFRNSGISAPTGSLILFQIFSSVIASAKLVKIIKHDKPIDGIYYGTYVFDSKSIRVFEPILAEEIKKIDNNFNNFTQVKQKIDSSKYKEIMSLIELKSSQITLPEEISNDDAQKYTEGSKKQIFVNAYERNQEARQKCINFHGAICKICDFDFSKFYGEDFAGKIHIHHKKSLAEIGNEYEVDPINDLVPVCPNCHMVLHSKKDTYSIEEVQLLLKKCVDNNSTF